MSSPSQVCLADEVDVVSEVSCRAVMVCLDHLDQIGVPRLRLVEGLPVTLAHLDNPRARVDWDTFVELLARFEELVGGPVALERVGEASPSNRGFALMRRLGLLSTDPAWIYRFICRFFGPATFSCIENELEELARGRLRVTLAIPPTHRDSPQFFRLCAGGFRRSSCSAGYPEAHVAASITTRRAVYDVAVPETERSLPRRAREWVARSLFSTNSLAVLHELQDELRGGYLGLQHANTEVQRQKALLERALDEQRRTQEELRQLERQLHRAQKLEGLGLLAGGIAHDFNNLLTVIVANAEIAVDSAPADHDDLRASLDAIREAGSRATELTAQLLTYAGRRPPRPRPLDLGALVSSVSNLLRPALPRHVTLVLDVPAAVPAVEGDGAQLQQVLMNLVGNAAEAVPHERGTVTVRTGVTDVNDARRRQAHLALPGPVGPHAFFEVHDDGAGIGDEALARIFDPFFSTKGEGRGLGLAAVMGTVRGHRGLLEVETRPGNGSVFRVMLPLSAQPVTVSASVVPASTSWRGQGVVLVVDDEELVRQGTRTALQRIGFDVLTAADGQDAVEQVRRHGERLTAIILDYTMPRLAGDAAFRAIRGLQPAARVILSSGNIDENVVDALRAEGLAAVLRKPYAPADLLRTLQQILGDVAGPAR